MNEGVGSGVDVGEGMPNGSVVMFRLVGGEVEEDRRAGMFEVLRCCVCREARGWGEGCGGRFIWGF